MTNSGIPPNWRWFVAAPLLVPLAIVILLVGWTHKPLWWLGQKICALSIALHPDTEVPKVIERILDWVRG